MNAQGISRELSLLIACVVCAPALAQFSPLPTTPQMSPIPGMSPVSGLTTSAGGMCRYTPPGGTPSCNSDAASQPGSSPTGGGNPIDLTNGNKYQREVDISLPGALGISFVRHYNSQLSREGVLGRGWSHSYETRLARTEPNAVAGANTAAAPTIDVAQGDGRAIHFLRYGAERDGVRRFVSAPAGFGIIEENIGAVIRLRGASKPTATESGGSRTEAVVWRWRWLNGRVLDFDERGLLSKIREVGGEYLAIRFDANRRLTRVADAHGLAIKFGYWGQSRQLEAYTSNDTANAVQAGAPHGYPGRLARLELSDGRQVRYGYDSQGNINEVRYADGTTKRYLYALVGVRQLLHEIIERDGKVWAQFDYNAEGYAVHTSHAQHVDEVSVRYQWPIKAGAVGTTWVTTNDGRKTRYRWRHLDGQPQIIDATGPGCSSCAPSNVRYEYADQGRRWSIVHVDEEGRSVEREQGATDQLGRLVHRERAIYQRGRLMPAEWYQDIAYEGEAFKPSRIATPSVVAGKVREVLLKYNAEGQPIELRDKGWDPLGVDFAAPWSEVPTAVERRLQLRYDPSGRLVRIVGPRFDGESGIEINYDGAARLQTVRYADGSELRVLAYDALGYPAKVTQTGAPTLELVHDAAGRMLSATEIGVSAARSVRYAYDQRGRLQEIISPDDKRLMVEYDAADRPTRYVDGGTGSVQSVAYDDDGQVTAELISDGAGQLLRTLAYSYDARHRLDSVRDGWGRTLKKFGYNADDRQPRTLIDPLGVKTLISYDGWGRVTRERAGDGGTTESAYNVRGDLVRVTTANGARTYYVFNDFGERVKERSADRGVMRYFYDAAGNLSAKVDGRGAVLRYRYDSIDRLTLIETTEGTTQLTYRAGRLTKTAGPWGEERQEYDDRGRLIAFTRLLGGRPYTTGYKYNAADQVVEKALPDGQSITYRRAPGEQSIERRLTVSEGATSHAATLMTTHWTLGPMATIASVDTYGNGLLTQTLFERESNQPISSQTPGVLNLHWEHDPAGRIVAIDDDDQRSRYQYDELGRLVGAAIGTDKLRFRYDLNGNRLAAGGVSGAGTSAPVAYRYAANSNRLQGAGDLKFAYDQAGEVTQSGEKRYEYDAAGRPVRLYVSGILRARYQYNAWGERIAKQVVDRNREVTSYFLYENHQLVGEIDGQGRLVRQYLYQGDRPVLVLQGREALYIHSDQVGFPRAVTNSHGEIIWRARYSPFGEAEIDDDPAGQGEHFVFNLRFAGQYADREAGTYYNYLRTYDPGTGRYTQPDRIGMGGGSNTYAYAGANTLKNVDPEGAMFFAFDGTGNGAPGDGMQAGAKPSNIWQLYNLAKYTASDPRFYITGIGTTNNAFHQTYSGSESTGKGFNERLGYATTDLNQFVEGPNFLGTRTMLNLDVVGFSRGAAEARVWVNAILNHTVNGLYSFSDNGKTYYACISFRFEGLFDTVPHMGWTGGDNGKYNFTIPSQVKYVVQALALNENRGGLTNFNAYSIMPNAGAPNSTTPGATRIEQGFLGAHSDIGGGYGTGDLSNATLTWMYNQATTAGVPLNPESLALRTVNSPIVHDELAAHTYYTGGRVIYFGDGSSSPEATVAINSKGIPSKVTQGWMRNFITYHEAKTQCFMMSCVQIYACPKDQSIVGMVDMIKYSAWLRSIGVNISPSYPTPSFQMCK